MIDDFHALTIAEIRKETAHAISVAFAVPPEKAELFRFKPGQHIALRAMLDGEEVRRNYSICAQPAEKYLRIAIKSVAGGRFSTWATATLRAGMAIDVMPPSGRFTPPPADGTARHLLLLAAGSGVTPMMAIASHVLGLEPDARVTFVYGNRALETIMFREALEDLKDKYMGQFTLLHVLSRNDEIEAPLFQGRITGEKIKALSERVIQIATVDHAFICGPGSMIKDVRAALFDLGMARERVHHEFFAPGGGAYRAKAEEPAAAPHSVKDGEGGKVEIVAIMDGVRHRFQAEQGEHVIDAALRAGLRVPYACKGGMCCTCRAKLVEGKAEMTANYSLEPWEMEKGFILTCQAVPKTDTLTVDYDAM
jgi:ring-1,2-phenylacetyl-CoA epoxidase subunit PaaE